MRAAKVSSGSTYRTVLIVVGTLIGVLVLVLAALVCSYMCTRRCDASLNAGECTSCSVRKPRHSHAMSRRSVNRNDNHQHEPVMNIQFRSTRDLAIGLIRLCPRLNTERTDYNRHAAATTTDQVATKILCTVDGRTAC